MEEERLPDWVKTSKDYERWKRGEEPDIAFEAGSEQESLPNNRQSRKMWALAVFGTILFLFCGFFRVYTGASIGLKVLAKHSFSFADTYVNLDDLMGMPRIAVAAQHPAVKRQLEEMGIIETDEQMQKRVMNEMEAEMNKQMSEWKRKFGY